MQNFDRILRLRRKFESAAAADDVHAKLVTVRVFHDLVLRGGSMPLSLLEQVIDEKLAPAAAE